MGEFLLRLIAPLDNDIGPSAPLLTNFGLFLFFNLSALLALSFVIVFPSLNLRFNSYLYSLLSIFGYYPLLEFDTENLSIPRHFYPLSAAGPLRN